MPHQNYSTQGRLAVGEAKIVLPLLEKLGIRFQIEADQFCEETDQGPFVDERIALFVHPEDVEAWLKIRDEFWKP